MRPAFIVKEKSGFSIVEMVSVVALVAILAAIAIPVYRDNQDNVRRKEAEAALFTILTAAKTYYYRNGDSFNNSNCGCATNNIWLNTAEICNHWTISTYTPAGQSLTIAVTGKGGTKYAAITSTLTFNASTGITTINGNPV